MNIEKMLDEMAREITSDHTITISSKQSKKRFAFKPDKLESLRKELSKFFGYKVVNAIIAELEEAKKKDELKNFAVDDSVDFVVDLDGGQLVSKFKQ